MSEQTENAIMSYWRARRGRRRRSIPPPCAGTAFSCLEVIVAENESPCTSSAFSRRKFKLKNKSNKTIWVLIEVLNYEMMRNFLIGRLDNEKPLIKKIPGKTTVDLGCEEAEILDPNPDNFIWRRRSYSIGQACYEQNDINCRYFPEVPTSTPSCQYTSTVDFTGRRGLEGSQIGMEFNAFFKMLSEHVATQKKFSGAFGDLFRVFSDIFGLDRGAYLIKSNRFENEGSSSFVDFEVNFDAVSTAWLKLQTRMDCQISGLADEVVMQFEENSMTPSLILGNCKIDGEEGTVTCDGNVIERPVEKFVFKKDRWLVHAYEYCLEIHTEYED